MNSSDGVIMVTAVLEDIEFKAYIADQSLDMISVGMLQAGDDCSFVWLKGHCPCLVTPSGKILILDVVHDVPYFLEDGLATYCTEPAEISRLCGVCIVDGVLQLTNRARRLGRRRGNSKGKQAAAPIPDDFANQSGRAMADADAGNRGRRGAACAGTAPAGVCSVRVSAANGPDSRPHRSGHQPAAGRAAIDGAVIASTST